MNNTSEQNFIPISSLQHFVFCRRQFALIHIEGIWIENLLTAQGRIMHERSDTSETIVRKDIRIAHGLSIKSLKYNIFGRTDTVEFHREEISGEKTCVLNGVEAFWKLFPIEYKRGKPKTIECDEIQLCAQTLCLEEMFEIQIDEGALFYGQTRRRKPVYFDSYLRGKTDKVIREAHELIKEKTTPEAVYSKKCRNCSLYDYCLPKITQRKQLTAKYYIKMLD